jgi:hypothetical protein
MYSKISIIAGLTGSSTLLELYFLATSISGNYLKHLLHRELRTLVLLVSPIVFPRGIVGGLNESAMNPDQSYSSNVVELEFSEVHLQDPG